MRHLRAESVLFRALTAALLFHCWGSAQAGDNGPYAGVAVGLGKSSALCNSEYNLGCNDRALTGKVLFGYRLNSIVGVEIGFTKMGKVKYSEARPSQLPGAMQVDVATANEFEVQYSAGFSVIAYAPFFGSLAPFAKIGLHKWAMSGERRTSIGASSGTLDRLENGTDLALGIGAEYRVGDQVSLRAEWERLSLDDRRWWEDDEIHNFSIGLLYRF